MPLKVFELEFDDWNESEAARHNVTPREIMQVLDEGDPVFATNKKGHAASILMIGPTLGGRFLTVPLAATPLEGRWRPATAFDSTAPEIARYRANRSTYFRR